MREAPHLPSNPANEVLHYERRPLVCLAIPHIVSHIATAGRLVFGGFAGWPREWSGVFATNGAPALHPRPERFDLSLESSLHLCGKFWQSCSAVWPFRLASLWPTSARTASASSRWNSVLGMKGQLCRICAATHAATSH